MNEKILILSPHTDDGELACGGTISRYIEEGNEVFYVAFSICEKSIPEGYPDDILKKECIKATNVLGIKEENRFIFNFPVRNFPEYRQKILDKLINLKEKINPDIIFMPSSKDIHQDHKTIYEEGLRAFKTKSILGYEFMWNNFSFNTNYYIKLSEQNVLKKVKSVSKYETQNNRDYTKPDVIKGMCFFRGAQISSKFAEAFEVIRWVK
ncbi:MAG: PIG-L deacetylase family protein [Nanobdellota archaeon]